MFRLYSKGCEYALRALTYAARQNEDARFRASDVCKQTGVPESSSRKIIQALVQGGFLRAVRGPDGGYVLSRNPDRITLLDVIRAVDWNDMFDRCVLRLPVCGTKQPCPLHETRLSAKQRLIEQLERKTLQELAEAAHHDRSMRRAGRPYTVTQ